MTVPSVWDEYALIRAFESAVSSYTAHHHDLEGTGRQPEPGLLGSGLGPITTPPTREAQTPRPANEQAPTASASSSTSTQECSQVPQSPSHEPIATADSSPKETCTPGQNSTKSSKAKLVSPAVGQQAVPSASRGAVKSSSSVLQAPQSAAPAAPTPSEARAHSGSSIPCASHRAAKQPHQDSASKQPGPRGQPVILSQPQPGARVAAQPLPRRPAPRTAAAQAGRQAVAEQTSNLHADWYPWYLRYYSAWHAHAAGPQQSHHWAAHGPTPAPSTHNQYAPAPHHYHHNNMGRHPTWHAPPSAYHPHQSAPHHYHSHPLAPSALPHHCVYTSAAAVPVQASARHRQPQGPPVTVGAVAAAAVPGSGGQRRGTVAVVSQPPPPPPPPPAPPVIRVSSAPRQAPTSYYWAPYCSTYSGYPYALPYPHPYAPYR